MRTTITLTLKRPARKLGGDRYEAEIQGELQPMVVYIPQRYSRGDKSEPAQEIKLTLES